MKKIKTAIFLSGEGTNFKSIYDTCLEKNCPFEIEIVISDRRCKGYDLSKSLNKKTYIFENCEKITFEKKTNMVLKQNQIDLICLAGFMKILSEDFVKKWNKKILNIHPSILPLFPGLNTYKKVIQYMVYTSKLTNSHNNIRAGGRDDFNGDTTIKTINLAGQRATPPGFFSSSY